MKLQTLIVTATFLFLGLWFQEPDGRQTNQEAPLKITYLVNEGYLFEHESAKVLIDAFVEKSYGGYAALSPDLVRKMKSAQAPFDEIDLALASHVHRDHFQAEPAKKFLTKSRSTQFAGAPEVLQELGKLPRSARISKLWPEEGHKAELKLNHLRIEALRLRHGGKNNAEIQNLGHIIYFEGKTVLHLGDAEMDETIFAPFNLSELELDVVIVPYWFFGFETGRKILRKHLTGKHLIATHVPPNQIRHVKKMLSERFPEVKLLTKPLESVEV